MTELSEDKATVGSISVSALYPLVVSYYRQEKDHINLTLEYDQRIQLLAYFKQEKLGPFTPEKDVETGYFDVVGSDRSLDGKVSRVKKVDDLLHSVSQERLIKSNYGKFMKNITNKVKAWRALGEMSKVDAQQAIIKLLESVDSNMMDSIRERWREKQASKENEQTRVQVQEKSADDRTVENSSKVKAQVAKGLTESSCINGNGKAHTSSVSTPVHDRSSQAVRRSHANEQRDELLDSNVFAPVALWCSPKAAKQFISQVRASSPTEQPENQLILNPGESVEVQVPTSTQASAVFFEFVTEKGDIGFGLKFHRQSDNQGHTWPLHELLPVTKRNCSIDLILGNHRYEHQGTYILQFDNSHSPTESKVVYYKVFYQSNAH